MSDNKHPTSKDSESTKNTSCSIDIPEEEKQLRDGRKSLTMPSGKGAKNKIRYVEGTIPLKDGCWLSENN